MNLVDLVPLSAEEEDALAQLATDLFYALDATSEEVLRGPQIRQALGLLGCTYGRVEDVMRLLSHLSHDFPVVMGRNAFCRLGVIEEFQHRSFDSEASYVCDAIKQEQPEATTRDALKRALLAYTDMKPYVVDAGLDELEHVKDDPIVNRLV